MEEKIKVLMVDDEAQFRTTTEKILKKKGFATIMAENGEDAIAKLSQNPDVIVLDVKMPKMDGHEALMVIKSRLPDVPVIMLTGHGALPSAKEALREGAYDYLTKPCDIDILTNKIRDAHIYYRDHKFSQEKSVIGIMIPLTEYTTVNANQTVAEAIKALKLSFMSKLSTSRLMETGHRSIIVIDDRKRVVGILTIKGLMKAILPKYLFAAKPSTADSVQYSPMFWGGMFTSEVKKMAKQKIKDIMSPAPLVIEGRANLMEAVHVMIANNARRLGVTIAGEIIGIIREQDLFFEMEKIINP